LTITAERTVVALIGVYLVILGLELDPDFERERPLEPLEPLPPPLPPQTAHNVHIWYLELLNESKSYHEKLVNSLLLEKDFMQKYNMARDGETSAPLWNN